MSFDFLTQIEVAELREQVEVLQVCVTNLTDRVEELTKRLETLKNDLDAASSRWIGDE